MLQNLHCLLLQQIENNFKNGVLLMGPVGSPPWW